jgi:hypothetical protein
MIKLLENTNVTTLLTAGLGAGAVEITPVVIPSTDTIELLGQLLIQLAIGIATIWRIIKKPKKQ